MTPDERFSLYFRAVTAADLMAQLQIAPGCTQRELDIAMGADAAWFCQFCRHRMTEPCTRASCPLDVSEDEEE